MTKRSHDADCRKERSDGIAKRAERGIFAQLFPAYVDYYCQPRKQPRIGIVSLDCFLRRSEVPSDRESNRYADCRTLSTLTLMTRVLRIPLLRANKKTEALNLGFLLGAERGIRTLGTFYRTHDFQSCALGQLSHLCTPIFYRKSNIIIKMTILQRFISKLLRNRFLYH